MSLSDHAFKCQIASGSDATGNLNYFMIPVCDVFESNKTSSLDKSLTVSHNLPPHVLNSSSTLDILI